MIYNSEQVTSCIPNACCSSDGAIDVREWDSRGEKLMNYDICIFVRRADLYATEKKNAGDTKPATDAHNRTKDETTVTTDQRSAT